MRLKKTKINKTERITSRVTEEDFKAIEGKALLYCEGNISEWVAYAALNFVPNKEDLEKTKK